MFFFSCKKDIEKEPDLQPVITLAKSSYGNQTVTTPKKNVKIAEYVLGVENVTFIDLWYADIRLSGAGVENVRLTVETVLDTFQLVENGTNGTFFAVETGNFTPGKYKLAVYADLTAMAGTIQTEMSIEYDLPTGTTVNTSFVVGQQITSSYKTTITLKKENVASTAIKNNELIDGYSFIASGKGAIKQIAYAVTFADNDTLSALSYDSLRMFVGDVNVTSEVTFYNNAGVKIVHLGEVTTKIYAVFTTESRVNGSEKYTIAGVYRNFGKGDGFTIVPIIDDAPQQSGFNFLNRGTSGGNLKLYSLPTASSGAQQCNFIYSNLAASDHSYTIGISSNDWMNGYGIVSSPLVKNIFQY